MEVHHHTHSPRKKWNHYFWEFFMLFLAVTLGFFVENLREHYIEHQRERQFVQSIVEDLKEDTASFHKVIAANTEACKMIDTLISLLKTNSTNYKSIYFLARTIPMHDADLICQDKTFEQLKGSGGLRLIRNRQTQNKIGTYYQITKFIEKGPTPMQFQNRRDLFDSYDEIFDAMIMQEIVKSIIDQNYKIPGELFKTINATPEAINHFCMKYHIIYSTKTIVSKEAVAFIDQAEKLIHYLSVKYHF